MDFHVPSVIAIGAWFVSALFVAGYTFKSFANTAPHI